MASPVIPAARSASAPLLSPPGGEPRWTGALAAVLGVVLALWAVATLSWPLALDHGLFAWIGDRITEGGMPYRDGFDQKGPVVFYAYALAHGLSGHSTWGVRVVDLFLVAAGGVAMARLVGRYASPPVAALAGVLLVLEYAQYNYYWTAQPDGWAAMWMIAAVLWLLTDGGAVSWRGAAGAALLIGVAALAKPTHGVFLLLPAVHLATASGAGRGERIRAIAAVTATLVVVGAGWAATLVAGHAVPAYLEALRYMVERQASDASIALHPAPPLASVLRNTLEHLATSPGFALLIPSAAAGAAALWLERRREALLILLWGALSLAVVVAQRKLFAYTWHGVYPVLVALGAVGLSRVVARGGPAVRTLAASTLALLVVALLPAPGKQVARWVKYAAGRVPRAEYLKRFDEDATDAGYSYERTERVARHLQRHTASTDRVFVWDNPVLSYLADRRSVGRFAVAPFYTAWATPARRAAIRSELLGQLEASPPEYAVVLGSQRVLPGRGPDPASDYTNLALHFPELERFLAERYRVQARIDGVEVLARRDMTERATTGAD